jgi:hypothetical protein
MRVEKEVILRTHFTSLGLLHQHSNLPQCMSEDEDEGGGGGEVHGR